MFSYCVNFNDFSYVIVHADSFAFVHNSLTVYFYFNDKVIAMVSTLYLTSIEKWNDLTESFSDIVFTK